MTESEFLEKNARFEKTVEARPDDAALFNDWGSHIFEWANEHIKEQKMDEARHIYSGAAERYQHAIELNALLVEAYDNLVNLNAHLMELDPGDKKQFELESAIINLGCGSAFIMKGDYEEAKERFSKSFETTKDTSKMSIVPFAFLVGIDFLHDKSNKKAVSVASSMLKAAKLSGFEEVTVICRAVGDGRYEKPSRETISAQAADKLAQAILAD